MTDPATEPVNKMIAWAKGYMEAWADLVDGKLDIEHTLDTAYEIWRTEGHRDPAEVAKDDFVADAKSRMASDL